MCPCIDLSLLILIICSLLSLTFPASHLHCAENARTRFCNFGVNYGAEPRKRFQWTHRASWIETPAAWHHLDQVGHCSIRCLTEHAGDCIIFSLNMIRERQLSRRHHIFKCPGWHWQGDTKGHWDGRDRGGETLAEVDSIKECAKFCRPHQ